LAEFEEQVALFHSNSVHINVDTICRVGLVCAHAQIEKEQRRAMGADDLTGIAHIKVDVWMLLRRFVPTALELAAANAHDRHPASLWNFG
jgi:hypothetical protein